MQGPSTTDSQLTTNGHPGNELAPTGPPPEPDQADDVVRWLRSALVAADNRRAELVESRDWEALAFGLDGLRKLAGDLAILTRSVEDDVARLLPAKRVTVDGLGRLEKKRANMRRVWREGLLDEVLRRAVVDPETGEVIDDEAMIRVRLLEVLPAVLPVTPSTAWKTRGLVELRINPSDWSDLAGGRMGILIEGSRR